MYLILIALVLRSQVSNVMTATCVCADSADQGALFVSKARSAWRSYVEQMLPWIVFRVRGLGFRV